MEEVSSFQILLQRCGFTLHAAIITMTLIMYVNINWD